MSVLGGGGGSGLGGRRERQLRPGTQSPVSCIVL